MGPSLWDDDGDLVGVARHLESGEPAGLGESRRGRGLIVFLDAFMGDESHGRM